MMAENKTKPTGASVSAFLRGVENDVRRKDAKTLLAMLTRVTGASPHMLGPTIIGFGTKHYRYESGREGDMPRIGFSPRKANLVLYGLTGTGSQELMTKLGKHKTGTSCLYINKLADVDTTVLEALAANAWKRSGEQR